MTSAWTAWTAWTGGGQNKMGRTKFDQRQLPFYCLECHADFKSFEELQKHIVGDECNDY